MFGLLNFRENAKKLNDLTYTDYYYRLMLLARSIFKWENLPDGMDEKWIEKYLYSEGRAIFYKHPSLGLMVSKCTLSGNLNHYDEPTELLPVFISCVDTPDVKPLKNNTECVLMRNNDSMMPTFYTINLYALRLTEIQRAIDININAQKTPILIKCSEKQKLSLKQVYTQWNGFEPVIYGDKNLDTTGIEALKTDAPVVFDKLQIQKHSVWNEVMTFLGINNANMDKRERLVDDEVQANNEQIELSADVMLKSREKACEQINKLFRTNISVRRRTAQELKETMLEGVVDA